MANHDDGNKKMSEDKPSGIEILAAALNSVESVRVTRVSAPHVCSFSPPQILFESSVEFAAALRKKLHADERAACPRLRVPWDVSNVWTNVLTSCFVFDADHKACYRGLQRPRIDFFSRVFRKKKLLQEIAALEATVSSDYEILVEMINSAAAQVLQEKSPGPMSDDSKKEE
ncbi:MAG: hypothetical protein Q4G66_13240 [bacterium]|nr:hypothetical protein [bacterium]